MDLKFIHKEWEDPDKLSGMGIDPEDFRDVISSFTASENLEIIQRIRYLGYKEMGTENGHSLFSVDIDSNYQLFATCLHPPSGDPFIEIRSVEPKF